MCQCMSSKINEVEGKPFTKIERIYPEQDQQVAVRLFKVASTQIGSEVLHQEMYKTSTPLIEIQAQAASLLNIDAQDILVSKL